MLGVVPTDEALRMAREAGMDLVEVSPNERPPVCRIMDYGKHKYDLSKRLKQKHHEQKIKEVRLRPKTDPHDREIKLRKAREFLEDGDRVQFTMLFRGRERFHPKLGMEVFDGIRKDLEDVAKLDRPARAMGRRMTMVLAPAKAQAGQPANPKPKPSVAPRPKPPEAKEQSASEGVSTGAP